MSTKMSEKDTKEEILKAFKLFDDDVPAIADLRSYAGQSLGSAFPVYRLPSKEEIKSLKILKDPSASLAISLEL